MPDVHIWDNGNIAVISDNNDDTRLWWITVDDDGDGYGTRLDQFPNDNTQWFDTTEIPMEISKQATIRMDVQPFWKFICRCTGMSRL